MSTRKNAVRSITSALVLLLSAYVTVAHARDEPEMVNIPGKDYAMGKFEVTQGEWKAVMGNNPSKFSNCGDTCPVEQVSWNDIQEFLQKLNAKTGKQYRLPTEAEWEYACYGGSQSKYCGGNNFDAVGWYNGNAGKTTHPVGQKQANGYGLYDMSGNVWEWMENKDDNEHDERARRGNSWEFEAIIAAFRGRAPPEGRDSNSGFRVARTLLNAAAEKPQIRTEQEIKKSDTEANRASAKPDNQSGVALRVDTTAADKAAAAKVLEEANKKAAEESKKEELANLKRLADEKKARDDAEAKRKAEFKIVTTKNYDSQLEKHQTEKWCTDSIASLRKTMSAGRNQLMSVGECRCTPPKEALTMYSCEYSYTYKQYVTSAK